MQRGFTTAVRCVSWRNTTACSVTKDALPPARRHEMALARLARRVVRESIERQARQSRRFTDTGFAQLFTFAAEVVEASRDAPFNLRKTAREAVQKLSPAKVLKSRRNPF